MSYKKYLTNLVGVTVLEPQFFSDHRGFFYESYNAKNFNAATGLDVTFVQDNHSLSTRGVLRGLHYQIQHPQGKLVRVLKGHIFDAVVDLRKNSTSFGKVFTIELSAENRLQLWVPTGFAHGFFTISESAEVAYKTTEYWNASFERSLLWSDPAIGIKWPVKSIPSLSEKDAEGCLLSKAEVYK